MNAITWFTLAALNAHLAGLRGRSPAGWLLLSLLVGPLATVALWVAGSPASDRGADGAGGDTKGGRVREPAPRPLTTFHGGLVVVAVVLAALLSRLECETQLLFGLHDLSVTQWPARCSVSFFP